MKNRIVIGIGGVARVGKNLFCDILTNKLIEKYKLSISSFSLALELKEDCRSFIKEKLNLDIYTENTQEKSEFRDMLVWYGDVMRKRTSGRYWIEKLQNKINTCNSDVIIVTDIRYDFYDKDEVYWIQKENNGILIHISKYTYGFNANDRHVNIKTNKKIFVDPANSHEALNDPKLKKKADYLIEWEDVLYSNNYNRKELLENTHLNYHVDEFITSAISVLI